jgi:hypothetical protein
MLDLLGIECGLPTFWNNNWGCELPTSYQCHDWCVFVITYMSKEDIVVPMEEIFVVLKCIQ